MSSNTYTALLVDIGGKQDYIFSSNKLKENIGASYIIAHELFGPILSASIQEYGGKADVLEKWKNEMNHSNLFEGNEKLAIGYIGGGNALLFFNGNRQEVIPFVQGYSYSVLQQFPGVQLGFGLIEDFDLNDWTTSMRRLNQSVDNNRSLNYLSATPFKHGIAADCPLSGEGQEFFDNNLNWISKQSQIKIELSALAYESFKSTYEDLLGTTLEVTNEIEYLNDADEKGYIAVVHIDGNGMGQEFRDCENLDKFRSLSKKVNEKLEASLGALVDYTTELCNTDLSEGYNNIFTKNGNHYFPFRSIINAGDDITFVCHGRLGIHLAEKYVEILANPDIGGKSIASCAGVAIVNKKYPFFRAYKLAEKLAGKAKEKSRGVASSESYGAFINYHISAGGYTGNFEELIDRKYKIGEQVMEHGPFELLSDTSTNTLFKDVKGALYEMLYQPDNKNKWPKNKLLALRHAITSSQAEQEYFKLQMKARGLEIKHEELYDFPYYDMIDLIEFYPKQLLQS